MPNCSPSTNFNQLPPSPVARTVRRAACILAAALAIAAASASAQILARPGYPGNSATVDLWWKHAIFYQVAAPPGVTASIDFKAITARLESLRTLGVDALLLPAPEPPAVGSTDTTTFDDLDDLLRQASAHNIRVLMTLHATTPENLSGLARFWLSRGVAGLYIATPPSSSPEATQALVQTVRKLASSSAGQRIVISDLDLAPPDAAQARSSHHANASRSVRSAAPSAQLQIDTRLDNLPALTAASLRPLLEQTNGQPNLLLDLHAPNSPDAHAPLAEVAATIAFLTHPSALIDSRANLALQPAISHTEAAEQPTESAPPPPPAPPPGTYLPYVPYVAPAKPHVAAVPKPIPPDPLATWYQQLAGLHGSNAGLRTGSNTFLDFDAQNALVWVSRPASPSPLNPPVFVVCNLSDAPVELSLEAAIKNLTLHGFYLRALLRSDSGMGAQDIHAVKLPPFGVYIGELRR